MAISALRAPARLPSAQASETAPRAPGVVDDVLVFERSERGFSLVGGAGRGAGWAGIVDLEPDDESLVSRAWQTGGQIRVAHDAAVQVCGPYHARYAVAVPVGDRHVVVFGSREPIHGQDSDLVRAAATVVDRLDGVPADKLLADELELVHAVRALMAYRPETVHDTLRHVATVAATALSCELAVIRVEHNGVVEIEEVDVQTGSTVRPDAAVDHWLQEACREGRVVVEQSTPAPPNPFAVEVAARMTLPIGTEQPVGTLVLAHRQEKPRGFTNLCQRIGRAVADAAQLLVTQATARERLSAERDVLARLSGTDSLTGIANRRAWDELVAHSLTVTPVTGYVISADLDDLKAANDCCGHAAGDALLQATAALLTANVRGDDVVARVGGDEFAILLRGADARTARRVRARIRRAEASAHATREGLRPRFSLGVAPVVDGDPAAALAVADRGMYADKRRRDRAPTAPPKFKGRTRAEN